MPGATTCTTRFCSLHLALKLLDLSTRRMAKHGMSFCKPWKWLNPVNTYPSPSQIGLLTIPIIQGSMALNSLRSLKCVQGFFLHCPKVEGSKFVGSCLTLQFRYVKHANICVNNIIINHLVTESGSRVQRHTFWSTYRSRNCWGNAASAHTPAWGQQATITKTRPTWPVCHNLIFLWHGTITDWTKP